MKTTGKAKPNTLLKRERTLRGWTQADVAGAIGTDGYTVNRWECGRAKPSPYFRQKLCTLFGKNAEELGFLDKPNQDQPPLPPSSPTIWTIPYRRNLCFTARDEVITSLFQAFHKQDSPIQTLAVCGLGGIGKTQTAIEYAYRYRSHYQAILWLQADSPAMLLSQAAKLAQDLNLSERDEQDLHRTIAAVRRWFEERPHWLLIMDNLEDLHMLNTYVPPAHQGRISLTTRLHSTGTVAHRVEMMKMSPQEGTLCLLLRSKLLPLDASPEQVSERDYAQAQEISLLMDGLPLALDQAGAYIEEVGCGLSGYLQRYQKHHAALLGRRGTGTDHPDPVATTWSLSFSRARYTNPAAADLLRLCAFLAPEMIAEEILSTLTPDAEADKELWLDEAISVLRRFSLIHRSPEDRTFTIHRLVQVVVKDQMDEGAARQWATRTVSAVNHVFPSVEFSTWQDCQRYLPQAQACASLIQQWQIVTLDAAHLLHRTGLYLYERAHYTQAEPFYEQARTLYEQLLGSEDSAFAHMLEDLACLYEALWKEEQAESLYQQALAIRRRLCDPQHADLAETLTKLAFFYYKKGLYTQAEPLCLEAVEIFERVFGPEHIRVAESLNHLAALYQEQSRYAEAEPLYLRALAIREQAFGSEHPTVAASLKTLGSLYHAQGHYAEAEPLYLRALAIRERTLGPDHPQTAASLRNLAMLYQDQGKYDRAGSFCQRTLAIRSKVFGAAHPLTGDALNMLAELYLAQGRDEEAQHYFLQALAIWEKTLEPDNVDLAYNLYGLAQLAYKRGDYKQATCLCERILAIRTQIFGENHPDIAHTLLLMATISQAQKRYEEAGSFYSQALTIMETTGASTHPRAATILYNLASLHKTTGDTIQALACCRRALAIQEPLLGKDHPETAASLALLAEL